MHGPAHIRAVLQLTRINAQFRGRRPLSRDRLDDMLKRLAGATELLESLPDDAERLEHTALAYQLRSKIHFAKGEADAGLDAGVRAGELFEQAGGRGENFGRFLHDFAVELHDLTVPGLPLQYARRAAEVLAPYGDRYRGIEEFVQRLEEGEGQVSEARVAALRRDLAGARRKHRAAPAQSLALALLATPEPQRHVDELHEVLGIAVADAFEARRQYGLERPVAALHLLIELYWNDLRLPDWTPSWTGKVLSEVQKAGRRELEPEVLAIRAVWHLAHGDTSEALTAAVASVAKHDLVALRSETSMVRLLTGRVNGYGRLFALAAAQAEHEPVMSVEVV